MATLARVGEFALIDAIKRLAAGRGTGVRVGIGDDAAVVRGFDATALTTDTLTETVHFERDWLKPRQLGRRGFRVAVSDLAAMGAIPRYLLLSLSLPITYRLQDATDLAAGLVRDAASVATVLVGGNVSRADLISLTVTVMGEMRSAPVTRSAARPGDAVFLSGPVGGAAAGVELLAGGCRSGALVEAFRRPPLRVALGGALAGSGNVHAMIDVSDGVAQDLGHICEASGVSAQLDVAALPIPAALRRASDAGGSTGPARPRLRRPALAYAAGGGDDYELLFTASPRAQAELIRVCAEHGCVLTRVGAVTSRDVRRRVVDLAGNDIGNVGYKHFVAER